LKVKGLFLLFLLVFVMFSFAMIKTGIAPKTRLYVKPAVSSAPPGGQFNITIEVVDVVNLWSWSWDIRWDNRVLNAVRSVEGPFLNQEKTKKTLFVEHINNEVGNFSGMCALYGELGGVSGRGTLLYIIFQVVAEGESECAIDIVPYDEKENPFGTILLEKAGDKTIIVDCIIEDGYFMYPGPRLYVDPSLVMDVNLSPGSVFSVNVSVVNVKALFAWEFFFRWDPTLFNVSGVVEGPFLSQAGVQNTTFFVEFNQTAGYAHANCTLMDENATMPSGNGTIATVTFVVEMRGSGTIDLYDTRLFRVGQVAIPHSDFSSFFDNAVLDVAVTSIGVSSTVVGVGDSVSVNVTVKNEGTLTKTFYVVVWAQSPSSYVIIGMRNVTGLVAGEEETLVFSWDTTGASGGEYDVGAESGVVIEEADVGDFNATNNVGVFDGSVTVAVPWDWSATLIITLIVVVIVGVAAFVFIRRRSMKV